MGKRLQSGRRIRKPTTIGISKPIIETSDKGHHKIGNNIGRRRIFAIYLILGWILDPSKFHRKTYCCKKWKVWAKKISMHLLVMSIPKLLNFYFGPLTHFKLWGLNSPQTFKLTRSPAFLKMGLRTMIWCKSLWNKKVYISKRLRQVPIP